MGITAAEIKFIRSLQQKKFRKQNGLFVVEGVKPVAELLQSNVVVESIYSTEDLSFLPDDFELISEKELSKMSALKSPNRVLGLAKIPHSALSLHGSLILLLDGIRDPGNLGTIIRTAKWFGIDDIICVNDCVDAFDRKVVQSTMGALFSINIVYEEITHALDMIQGNGYSLLGTVMDGESIYKIESAKRMCLVIGSESHGMSEELREACNKLISIPNLEGEQTVESLNAAIATGIVISELKRCQPNG